VTPSPSKTGAGAVWACGLVALALFAGLALTLSPLEPSVVALQFAFTPRAFAMIVHAWPPEDLARYRAHLPVDGALLVAYGAFGYLLATRTRVFAAFGGRLRALAAWTMPLAAAFDAAEDLLHAWLTAAPRFGVPGAYAISAACSTAKWALLAGFAAVLVTALARGPAAPRKGTGPRAR